MINHWLTIDTSMINSSSHLLTGAGYGDVPFLQAGENVWFGKWMVKTNGHDIMINITGII